MAEQKDYVRWSVNPDSVLSVIRQVAETEKG